MVCWLNCVSRAVQGHVTVYIHHQRRTVNTCPHALADYHSPVESLIVHIECASLPAMKINTHVRTSCAQEQTHSPSICSRLFLSDADYILYL
jgi:hypothetical protein